MLDYDSIITDQPMDTDELVAKLETILDVRIPKGTLRRWAWEGLVSGPTPYGRKGQRGGRFVSWPPETVENAAVIYTLRNENIPLASIETRGTPRASGRNKDKKTIPTKTLLASKAKVDSFYASLDEASKGGRPFAMSPLLVPANPLYLSGSAVIKFRRVQKKQGTNKTGTVFGDARMQNLIIMWIATLEKIRHGKPLDSPVAVVFNWVMSYDGGDKMSLKTRYAGVSFEHSDHDTFREQFSTTPEALELLKSFVD